jgi:hypothetical protein
MIISMLAVSGCTMDPSASQDRGGYAAAARAHEVFADDFKNAGRQEQAKYHAEKLRKRASVPSRPIVLLAGCSIY